MCNIYYLSKVSGCQGSSPQMSRRAGFYWKISATPCCLASLAAGTAQQWYERAFVVLRQIQRPENTDAWSTLPRYDRKRLQAELDVFPQWFIQTFLGLPAGAMADSGFDGQ